jgi:hypothetical protein
MNLGTLHILTARHVLGVMAKHARSIPQIKDVSSSPEFQSHHFFRVVCQDQLSADCCDPRAFGVILGVVASNTTSCNDNKVTRHHDSKIGRWWLRLPCKKLLCKSLRSDDSRIHEVAKKADPDYQGNPSISPHAQPIMNRESRQLWHKRYD